MRNVEMTDAGCLIWQGSTHRGYGRINVDGRVVLAHRLAYELAHGQITNSMTVDHLCRNRACINVAHMELVSAVENWRRGLGNQKGRCKKGHGDARMYVRKDGSATCLICRELRRQRYARA